LFSGNHWNFDVISNGNVAENRLPGPVSLAVVGKKVLLERKAWETDVPWRVIFHQVVGAFVRLSNRVTSHHHLGLGWLSVYQKRHSRSVPCCFKRFLTMLFH
jgi:hypothetical protein